MRLSALIAAAALIAVAAAACAAAADPAVVKGVPAVHSAEPAPSKTEKEAAPTPVTAPASSKDLLADDGLKPWDISATKTTITLSWISFVLLMVAACFVGSCCGYVGKQGKGDKGAQYLQINTDAHDLY